MKYSSLLLNKNPLMLKKMLAYMFKIIKELFVVCFLVQLFVVYRAPPIDPTSSM